MEYNAGKNYRVGIGSFAFRYSVGTKSFAPHEPMNCGDFLRAAHQMGYQGVQWCENLMYTQLGDEELHAFGTEASRLGMFVELGMNGLSEANLARHFDIARMVGADLIRIVIGGGKATGNAVPRIADAIGILKNALPLCRRNKIVLGIENHFDLPTVDIVKIAREIDEAQVGLIFDTTNALGFLEEPNVTLGMMRPYLIGCHIKDYRIDKVEGGYLITGAPLGKGLLNTEHMLSAILSLSKNISVILESFQRRDDRWGVDEVLSWERRQLQDDTQYLLQCLQRMRTKISDGRKVEAQ